MMHPDPSHRPSCFHIHANCIQHLNQMKATFDSKDEIIKKLMEENSRLSFQAQELKQKLQQYS